VSQSFHSAQRRSVARPWLRVRSSAPDTRIEGEREAGCAACKKLLASLLASKPRNPARRAPFLCTLPT
jgi:hypothetical protein